MPERDRNKLDSAQQEADKLLDQIKNSEFGSVAYQAASDFFQHKVLDRYIGILRERIIKHPDDNEERVDDESRLRIEEVKMALLEHDIEQKQILMKGYANIYGGIGWLGDELNDASDNFAGDTFLSNVDNAVEDIKYKDTPSFYV